MKAILDTSSLLHLALYYIPVDKSGQLKTFIETKYHHGDIVVIDKVIEECQQNRGGLVMTEFPFLKDKKLHIKTEYLLPDQRFFNLLKNEFINHDLVRKKDLSPTAVDLYKNNFLNSADCKMLLYAQSIASEGPLIVTEETRYTNDGKIVKKIPSNCHFLNISCCSLPTLLSNHYQLEFRLI